MKLASWFSVSANLKQNDGLKFLSSPYLSVRSLKYHPHSSASILIRLITFSLLTAFSVVMARHYLTPLSVFEIMLISPMIYFFTESIGAFGQLLFYSNESFPIHRNPIAAISLSNFWGRDWNLWVQDWLRDVSEGIGRKRNHRIIIVFLISGLFHELMCNLPYWIVYKKSYFGTMMGYFLIQAVALWIDKKFMRHGPLLFRKIYLWIAVIVPSPLFINVPLLTFFGLTND